MFNARRALEPTFGEQPEMGWIFSTEVHGQGIAHEACCAALEWADAKLPPTPIWAIVSLDNMPSLKLAARLGFERLPDSVYHGETIAVLKRTARA